MDINEFFREVTLRLCGNLEIEEGLRSCMECISRQIPADKIYLGKWESAISSMRVVARADSERGEAMEVLIPLKEPDDEALAEDRRMYESGELERVTIVNNPDDEPITKHLEAIFNEPPSSTMSLPLIINRQIAGNLVLLAKGPNRYTEQHAQLYATLREPFFVAMSNTLKYREVKKLKDLLADDNRYLHKELRRISGDDIVGANFGLKKVTGLANQVAALESPVLLLGETGTGKDVIANAIHYSSQRKDGPFIKINCGAIPDTLIDSELFGHEKGAFTGALNQKRGCFERAMNGTVFLDEIGELPMQAQVRLLRVLQDKEIQRVGGEKVISLDVRVIAATNRRLEQMVKEGTFREDLWFRLNVFPISIPPLRERKSDIPALVQHFVEKKAAELKLPDIPPLAPDTIDAMMSYDWPGNVRELANIVERALILNSKGPIAFEGLGAISNPVASPEEAAEPEPLELDYAMSNHIQQVLKKVNGRIHGKGGAAELLGINPNTLRSRMKKLGITN